MERKERPFHFVLIAKCKRVLLKFFGMSFDEKLILEVERGMCMLGERKHTKVGICDDNACSFM